MARAFTNRTEMANTPIEPGSDEKYIYIPRSETGVQWTPEGETVSSEYGDYTFKGLKGKSAVIDGKPIIAGGQYIPQVDDYDPNTAPTEPIETLENNIPMDRDKFRESLVKQFGEDPEMVSITEKATNIVKSNIQALWDHTFQGKVPWGGRLTEDQLKFWNKQKSEYYALVHNSILEQNKLDRDVLESNMNRFDKEAERIQKVKEKELERKQSLIDKEAERKADVGVFEEKEKIKRKHEKPEKPKTYTVSPGEQIIDSEGNEIYTAPAKPEKPTGTLTENQVSQNLLDLAIQGTTKSGGTTDQIYAKYYGEYRNLISAGMSREDAYNELLKKHGTGTQVTTTTDAKDTSKTFKHLWD